MPFASKLNKLFGFLVPRVFIMSFCWENETLIPATYPSNNVRVVQLRICVLQMGSNVCNNIHKEKIIDFDWLKAAHFFRKHWEFAC